MTKERRIAIEMWEYIRDHYDDYLLLEKDGEESLDSLKVQFLKYKGIKWICNCWFCHYIAKRMKMGFHPEICRAKCPLKSCNTGPFSVFYGTPEEEEYVEACNEIIEALAGNNRHNV